MNKITYMVISVFFLLSGFQTAQAVYVEGCTPGFWKNHHDDWADYSPDQTLDSVFEFPNELSHLELDTLADALKYGGGPDLEGAAKIMLRHAVAALLNATHPDVAYSFSEDLIRYQVETELLTLNRDWVLVLAGKYEALNEQGCPL